MPLPAMLRRSPAEGTWRILWQVSHYYEHSNCRNTHYTPPVRRVGLPVNVSHVPTHDGHVCLGGDPAVPVVVEHARAGRQGGTVAQEVHLGPQEPAGSYLVGKQPILEQQTCVTTIY